MASTAPADAQFHFVPPSNEPKMTVYEEESVSNFSLPVNERGIRRDEASHDSHHLKINAAGSSCMNSSQSVAEDGLRTV